MISVIDSEGYVESIREIPDYFKQVTCLVINGDPSTDILLKSRGINVMNYITGSAIDENVIALADFVLLTGGTDISTSIYKATRDTMTDEPDAERDFIETSIVKLAKVIGIPVVGICRGAQLLSCMYGGYLTQHDTGGTHLVDHDLVLANGDKLSDCCANHHQLIHASSDCKVLATYKGADEVIRHGNNALSFQYHPEWHAPEDVQVSYFFKQIQLLIEGLQ